MTNINKIYLAILLGVLNIAAPVPQSAAMRAVKGIMELSSPEGSLKLPEVLINELKNAMRRDAKADIDAALTQLNLKELKDANVMGDDELAELEALVTNAPAASSTPAAPKQVTAPLRNAQPQAAASPATSPMLSDAALAYLRDSSNMFRIDEEVEAEISQAFGLSRFSLALRQLEKLFNLYREEILVANITDCMELLYEWKDSLTPIEKVEGHNALKRSDILTFIVNKYEHADELAKEIEEALSKAISDFTQDELKSIKKEFDRKMLALYKSEYGVGVMQPSAAPASAPTLSAEALDYLRAISANFDVKNPVLEELSQAFGLPKVVFYSVILKDLLSTQSVQDWQLVLFLDRVSGEQEAMSPIEKVEASIICNLFLLGEIAKISPFVRQELDIFRLDWIRMSHACSADEFKTIKTGILSRVEAFSKYKSEVKATQSAAAAVPQSAEEPA